MPFVHRALGAPRPVTRQRRGVEEPAQFVVELAPVAFDHHQVVPALGQDLRGQACGWVSPASIVITTPCKSRPASTVAPPGSHGACARPPFAPRPALRAWATRLTSTVGWPCAPAPRTCLPSMAWPASRARLASAAGVPVAYRGRPPAVPGRPHPRAAARDAGSTHWARGRGRAGRPRSKGGAGAGAHWAIAAALRCPLSSAITMTPKIMRPLQLLAARLTRVGHLGHGGQRLLYCGWSIGALR